MENNFKTLDENELMEINGGVGPIVWIIVALVLGACCCAGAAGAAGVVNGVGEAKPTPTPAPTPTP
ncbi:MAG: class IIb bacteriocin, lactobin A/cerein 7B family [Spirochaetales bacterium]|nr:class IIb bacteriocin, lactobin A/cerein 7B family [Spirochaetales bacterium]